MRFYGAGGGCALVIAVILGIALLAVGGFAILMIGVIFAIPVVGFRIYKLIAQKRGEIAKRNAAQASVKHIKRLRSMKTIPSPDGTQIEFENNPPHWDESQKWWFDGARWINAYPSPPS